MTGFRIFLIAVVVAVVSVVGISWAWTAIGGGPLPIHGLVALTLGVVGTIALAWVLMALASDPRVKPEDDGGGWRITGKGPPDPTRPGASRGGP